MEFKDYALCKTFEEGLKFIKEDQKITQEERKKKQEENDKEVILDLNKYFHCLLKSLNENQTKEFNEEFKKLKDYEQYGFKMLLYKNQEKAFQRLKSLKYMKFTLKNKKLDIDIKYE